MSVQLERDLGLPISNAISYSVPDLVLECDFDLERYPENQYEIQYHYEVQYHYEYELETEYKCERAARNRSFHPSPRG